MSAIETDFPLALVSERSTILENESLGVVYNKLGLVIWG